METALEASLRLSGSLLNLMSILMIEMLYFLTCLIAISSPQKRKVEIYFVGKIKVHASQEVVVVNYLYCMNHLMMMIIAVHMQIYLVMISQWMVLVSTYSLTRRMDSSQ